MGPVLGAKLAARWGLRAPFLFCSTTCVTQIVLMAVVYRETLPSAARKKFKWGSSSPVRTPTPPQLTPPSQHTQLLLLLLFLHLRHLLPLPPSRSGAPGGDRARRCGRRYFQMGDKVQVDGEEVSAGLKESAKERPNLPWNPV